MTPASSRPRLVVAMRGADEGADAADELKRAWRRFVALLAADRPLAIGVDDAHWADEGTLNLLEEDGLRPLGGSGHDPLHLPARARRATARFRPHRTQPHADRARCRWMAPSATRLAELLLPDRPARDRGPNRRCRGRQPLLHGGGLARRIREDRRRPFPSVSPTPFRPRLPLASTCCPPEEKRTLQIAAVLGHTFAQGPLEDLLVEGTRACSRSLRRRALVEERTTSDAGQLRLPPPADPRCRLQLAAARRAGHPARAGSPRPSMSYEPFAERAGLVAYHLDHADGLSPTAGGGMRPAPPHRRGGPPAPCVAGPSPGGRRSTRRQADLVGEAPSRWDWLIAAGEVALRRWRGDYAIRLYREIGETAERIGDPRAAAGTPARSRSAPG